MVLQGKKILLGISGGIAAYKSCELLRLLQKKSAIVRVCMTENATKFVAPLTFASLSKCPVYLKDGAIESRPFLHIDFPHWADLYIVAPATANIIGKFACGLADDPVSLCFLSSTCPKIIAPAMNSAMFNAPAVKRNLQIIKDFADTTVLEAPTGILACGESGKGRLMEPKDILHFIEAMPEPKKMDFAKKFAQAEPIKLDENPYDDINLCGHKLHVLLTAGRTEEFIDPVRYISNRSSGKTAVAIASVFYANGFKVDVVAGPMEAEFSSGIDVTHVKSACEMHDSVMQKMPFANIIIHCAAVADYRPKIAATKKIKDSRSQLMLELVPNPNILRDCCAQKKPTQIVIGFALETDNFKEHAQEKLTKSGANALLLNAPVALNSGFGKDCVQFTLVEPGKKIDDLTMGNKVDLAETILKFCIERINEQRI